MLTAVVHTSIQKFNHIILAATVNNCIRDDEQSINECKGVLNEH